MQPAFGGQATSSSNSNRSMSSLTVVLAMRASSRESISVVQQLSRGADRAALLPPLSSSSEKSATSRTGISVVQQCSRGAKKAALLPPPSLKSDAGTVGGIRIFVV